MSWLRKNKPENSSGTTTDSELGVYLADGKAWEQDISRRNARSRSIAWIIACTSSLIAIGSIAALLVALPLKTYEPYMVVVDRSMGFVEVKRPLAEGALQQDEAMATFDVVRYVKARETYDPRALKDNYDLAELLSTGEAATDLTNIYSPSNPSNPIKLLGTAATISVTIKSVTFPNSKTALVRFSTEEKSQTTSVVRHWVSLVRYRYTSSPAKNDYRFENPLGFQVTEYRRDQETVSSGAPSNP